MADEEKTLKLLSLDIQNVLRLKAVRLEMGDDGVIIIEGGNEQGKTSVLKALEMILAGGKKTPDVPLNGDASKGQIIAEIGHLVVTKKFRAGKSPILTVTTGKGKKMAKPQTILDELLSLIALDPLAFMGQDDKAKRDTLAKLMGYDSSQFDAEYAKLFEERKWAKKEAKAKLNAMNEAPRHTNAPDEVIDVKELMEELKRRQEHNAEIADAHGAAAHANDTLMDTDVRLAAVKQQIAQLQQEHDALVSTKGNLTSTLAQLSAKAAGMQPEDEASIEQQIANADDLNRKRRDNDRHNELRREANAAEAKWEKLEEMLKAVAEKKEKARISASANLPVSDLALTDDGVTYKGKPLSQAGGSAQLRVSVAVAVALNKDKRVKLLLIDDAEKLDAESTKALLEMAHEAGFQVIMARVGDGKEASVVIEDGMVRDG